MKSYNKEVIIDFEIVQMYNFKTEKTQEAIFAKWGKGRYKGYMLPYRFDTYEEAIKKGQELMPVRPMAKSELIAKVQAEMSQPEPVN